MAGFRVTTMSAIAAGLVSTLVSAPAAAQSYEQQIKDCGTVTRCSSDHLDALYRNRDALANVKQQEAFAAQRQQIDAQIEGDRLSRLQQVMRRRRAAAAAAAANSGN